ncbi:Uu.00g073540.m01.CDS01 [Anthostomella pinea]|uniref:Uu.00g073540.m01.CDS01 n=1 Tax=Anthostomella pinea TaxID=933095 RepID=A0AAI8VW21_9PEZI|nr:Uu.00g073540.m01.CDS01 [Anthostomella pinea]
MAPTPQPHVLVPPTLKNAQLKRLAFLCGLQTSGLKRELVARLNAASQARAAELTTDRGHAATRSVLSIDLGIRNLALSHLTAPPIALHSSSSSILPRKRRTKDNKPTSVSQSSLRWQWISEPTRPPQVYLHAWQHRDIFKETSRDGGLGLQAARPDGSLAPDPFSPASLALVAVRLVRQDLLKLDPVPTHVIIERQRFRTMGRAAVPEWTLRVNMLEAMLHASLRTLRELGLWRGEVHSVLPRRTEDFWLEGDKFAVPVAERVPEEALSQDGVDVGGAAVLKAEVELDSPILEAVFGDEEVDLKKEGRQRNRERLLLDRERNKNAADYISTQTMARRTKGAGKKLKIDILGNWLGRDKLIVPKSRAVKATLKAFDQRWRRTAGVYRPLQAEEDGDEHVDTDGFVLGPDVKLDDLTDSLLQGMAWMRWEENKTLLCQEGGIEKLLELGTAEPVLESTFSQTGHRADHSSGTSGDHSEGKRETDKLPARSIEDIMLAMRVE